MNTFRPGEIVRFNNSVLEFCDDLEVYIGEVQDIMMQTFLIVDVFEETLEVEVMTSDGSVLRLGMHDLESAANEAV
tara:strand:- start:231 stop:458 length:228 start_codon:yes stop_codon:yes gene_type:complete